jgi:hypothetical protein
MLFFPETILKNLEYKRFLLTGQKHLMERFILSMLSSKNLGLSSVCTALENAVQ